MDYLKILRLSLLFLGRSILAILGASSIIVTFVDMFEGTLSITELSNLELIFSAIFCLLLYRHGKISIILGLKWFRVLYLPLRNCGWMVVLMLSGMLFLILQGDSLEHINTEISSEAIMDQLFGFGLILFCIYIATPRIPSEQSPRALEPEEVGW